MYKDNIKENLLFFHSIGGHLGFMQIRNEISIIKYNTKFFLDIEGM